jgi:hypothetical protein
MVGDSYMAIADREKIQQEIEHLSPESLSELRDFIAYLQYKEQKLGSPWAKELYDLLTPLRDSVAESGMSSDAIDQLLDEELEEVRRERKS